MKKILAVVLFLTLICTMLAGCGGAVGGGYEIALITDKGNIDDKSFNQGSWEGIVDFAKANNITHKYYKPEEDSDAGYLAAIDLAVTGGAKVVVTPGYLFEVPVYEAQTKHPDVKFILLDGEPHAAGSTEIDAKENVACIKYSEEQSGYLAGYAVVADGYKKLGFMGGMSIPAVQAYGYGYLQGAEAAATKLGLPDGSVSVIYHYTGDFAENDTNKATTKTMYQEGAEVVFACGGSVGKSVMAAAAEAGKKVVGVDSDQRYDSDTVITSAMKSLNTSVKAILESIYKNDSWSTYAGKTTYLDAKSNSVGLPTVVIGDEKANAFDRFKSFSKADYDELYKTLTDGSAKVIRSITVADTKGVATADELVKNLNLKKVTVTVR